MSMIVDRYLSQLFVSFFLASLVVFITLYIAIDFMTNLVRYEAAFELVFYYYLTSIPSLFSQLFPLSCLIATLFTFSTLSRNNELVALMSCGLSLRRLSVPILGCVIFFSGLNYGLQEWVGHHVHREKNYVYYVQIRNQPQRFSTVKTDKIWFRSGNVLFYLKTLHPEQSRANGLTLYTLSDEWRIIQVITAETVHMQRDHWILSAGTITLLPNPSQPPIVKEFDEKIMPVAQDLQDIQYSSPSSDQLSRGQLKRYIERNRQAGLDTVSREVDYHAKLSFSVAGLLMTWLAIPLGLFGRRSGGAARNIGFAIVLGFLYWMAYSSGVNLGKYGYLTPWLGAWVGNIAAFFLGVFLFWRAKLQA